MYTQPTRGNRGHSADAGNGTAHEFSEAGPEAGLSGIPGGSWCRGHGQGWQPGILAGPLETGDPKGGGRREHTSLGGRARVFPQDESGDGGNRHREGGWCTDGAGRGAGTQQVEEEMVEDAADPTSQQ